VTAINEKTLKSARKAKGAGHLRRGEILSAAERIFVREGYHGATIRKIADEVGVSSTALYMHFRDKSEILVEICESAFAKLLALNVEIAAQPGDPVSHVRRMLEAYMQFGLDNPNAYQLVFSPPPGALSEEKAETIKALSQRVYVPFSEAVERARAAGKLKSDNIGLVSNVLWAGTHGLVSLLLTQSRFDWSASPEVLKQSMLDSLFHGLLTD
jgi:AcrR family transcriptional regulator